MIRYCIIEVPGNNYFLTICLHLTLQVQFEGSGMQKKKQQERNYYFTIEKIKNNEKRDKKSALSKKSYQLLTIYKLLYF